MSHRKWTKEEIKALYTQSFLSLLVTAHSIHIENFKHDEVELCTLLSIKTGSCPEDCAYCPQSAHYKTNVQKESLINIEDVLAKAELAKKNGSTRFCIAAGWRNPPKKEFKKVLEMISEIKAMGLETCATIGIAKLV